ncbi:MAG: Mrp/NBP35 family ATP-binding protein [Eubacteriaceae bacterium]|nr:Mrp/NBP35 family ATP-binding protein [Eubacteriaceae bacterium]
MSENCSHDCGSCGVEGCGDRTPESLIEKPHELSQIKKVIGVVSGKGGVGKSSVSALAAISAQKMGYRAAIMDADVTGPSIPRMFGVEEQVFATEEGIMPAKSKSGIELISTNLILENPGDPVIWRGPVIAGLVKQFWTDVIWGDVDFLFIDMPPGTGDVPLTVFQTIPVDGIIVVASPQELVSMIVEKALKMAEMMDIPVLGLIENMSYVKCPDCGKEIKIFGESHIDEAAEKHGLEVLAKIPVDPSLALGCDKGLIELYEGDWLGNLEDKYTEMVKK